MICLMFRNTLLKNVHDLVARESFMYLLNAQIVLLNIRGVLVCVSMSFLSVFIHFELNVLLCVLHVVENTRLPVYVARVSMSHQSLNTDPMSYM